MHTETPRTSLLPTTDSEGPAASSDVGVIEVWSASLVPPVDATPGLESLLSPDELARAARFVSRRDRDRFVAGRAFLRLLLGRHAGRHANDLRFVAGEHGKPALAPGSARLEFNLAHSGTLAVCALAPGHDPVGADVERVRAIRDVEALARTALSTRELDHYRSIPSAGRLVAFYEAWTRKEAFLKALGCGLARSLQGFDVAFGPGEKARLLRSDRPGDVGAFALHALELRPGYVGAVAVAGRPRTLRLYEWNWRTIHLAR